MKIALGLRAIVCAVVIGITVQGADRSLAVQVATTSTRTSPAFGGDLLSAFAQQTTAADVLPQAYVAAARVRLLPMQLAEAVAPASRNADGPGGAVAALAVQIVGGQEGGTPNPLAAPEAPSVPGLSALETALGFSPPQAAGPADPLQFARGMVDPSSGALHLTYQDLSIPARGQPLALQRTFAPRQGFSSAMGAGWAFSYGMRLTYDSTGNPMIEESTGVTTHFAPWQTPSTYRAVDAPEQEVLTIAAGGSARRVMADGSSQQFDSQGRLVLLQDRAGDGLTLHYGRAGLASVEDAAGRSLRFTLDATGLISAVTDPTGATLHFKHDGAGNLMSVTTATGNTTHYTYSNPAPKSYDLPRMTSVTFPRGGKIGFSYDAGARVARIAGPGALETTITYASEPGVVWTYFADATGARAEIDSLTQPATLACETGPSVTCPPDATVSLSSQTRDIDPSGRVTTLTSSPAVSILRDGEGHVTQVVRDSSGRPVILQSPARGMVRVSYDTTTSALTSLTDATGHTTTLIYDTAGRLDAIRDGEGNLTRIQQTGPRTYHMVGAAGRAVTVEFDADGDLTDLIDTLGRHTQMHWDADGRLLSLDEPGHGSLIYRYNADGTLAERTDARGAHTFYTHDADGNLTSVTDGLGHTWRFSYDIRDLPVAMIAPAGQRIQFSYDADGLLTAVTDSLGHGTHLDYDGAGRLTAVVDPTGAVRHYSYGAAGELVAVTSPAGHTTRYNYDKDGRPSTVIEPDGVMTSLVYDAAGRVRSKQIGGATTTYSYDGAGQLTGQTVTDGSGSTYSYDAADDLTRATNKNGTIQNGYDAAGDLMSTADATGHVVRYTYDGAGRRTTMTAPTGAVTRYQYDAAGHLTAISDPLGTTTFRYNALGERTAATLPGGLAVSYGYDPAGDLTGMIYRHGATLVASFGYSYDGAGNVLTEQAMGITRHYRYDAADRLVAVSSSNGQNARYSYDTDGNLLSSPAGKGLQYDAGGRLVAAGGNSLGYDAADNLTAGPDGARYGFDQSGHLITSTEQGSTITYTVDALNRAVTRTSGKQTTATVYDGSDPLVAYGPGQKAAMRTLYGPWIDEPLVSVVNGKTYTYIQDSLGNVRAVVNSAGKTVATFEYDAYGRIIGHSGSAPTSLGYDGRPADPATGLIDLRNRLYDPSLGRFLSPDPLALPGAPHYAYAGDNPSTRRDPLGLEPTFATANDALDWANLGASGASLGTGLANLGIPSAAAGGVSVGISWGQAINDPSDANIANAGLNAGSTAVGAACGACTAPAFVAGVYASAAVSFMAAASAFNNGAPPAGNGVRNTDPTFIDSSAPAQVSSNGAATPATLMLAGGRLTAPLDLVYPVAMAGTATVTVYDARGQLVRTLATSRAATPPALTVTWDGRDAAGHAVAAGSYEALIDLAPTTAPLDDQFGLQAITVTTAAPTAPMTPTVLSAAPGLAAHIVVPADGALVEGWVPIDGDAWGSDFDQFIVDYGAGGDPSSWTQLVISNKPVQPVGPVSLAQVHTLSGTLADFNTGLATYVYNRLYATKPAIDGLMTIRLRVFGRHGEVVETSSRVVVGRAVPYAEDAVVDSPDGQAHLAIPSLSLHNYAQLFAIEPVASAPALPSGTRHVGKVYVVSPAGYTFSAPVTLALALPRGAANVSLDTWSATAGQWQPVPDYRTANGAELAASLARINATPALYTIVQAQGQLPVPLLLAPANLVTSLPDGTLTGLATPGARVTALVNGRSEGVTIAGADGLFTVPGLVLQPGLNSLRAVARDIGQTSKPSSSLKVRVSPPVVTIAALQLFGDDFSTPAPTLAGPGDRIGVEVRIGSLAHPPDGFTIRVASGRQSNAPALALRWAGGLIYRGVFAIGSELPPDLSPDQATSLVGVPLLSASGRSDIIRVSAGHLQATIPYRDTAGPPAPELTSTSHLAAIATAFARPDAVWPADPAPLGATLSRVPLGKSTDTWALRVTAGPTGEMIARVPVQPFNLAAHPLLSFSYAVPPTVSVDLAVHVNGVWHVVGLSDAPPSAYDFQHPYFVPLWTGSGSLIRDGAWHTMTFNLYQAMRGDDPTGAITVDRMVFGDWESVSWMAIQPSLTNAPGSSFMLGAITLPAASRTNVLRFSWSDSTPSGIAGYSYVLDQQPGTIPPPHAITTATSAHFGPLTSETWWFHVRAVDRAGTWGPAAHYPVIVDTLPPVASAPDPAPGQTGNADVTVHLPDLGQSGIDPATLQFSAFGHVYGTNSGAISYNTLDDSASFNLGALSPTPPQLFPGGQVHVALVAAADAAGNHLAHPLAWSYTLDVPTSLPGSPQLLTTRGGDEPSFSPDGTRVVFVSSRQGGAHLWTIDAGDVGEHEGTARMLVSGAGTDADPAWSPDGSSIVLSSTRGGGTHIWLVRPDGSGLRQLTIGSHTESHPTWSPDGKTIAFERDGDLWKIDADGRNLIPVFVNGDHAEREPAWSPDGKLIAFQDSLYVDQIWTVQPDGAHASPLTALGQGEAQSAPAWQANGTLAYVSSRANVVVLYTVDPDGSDQHPLISQRPARIFAPTASRDGAVFGFASTLTGRTNVWVSRDFRITPLDTSVPAFDAAAGKTVTLVFGTTSVATVTVTLADSTGRTVRVFARDQHMATGTRRIVWDGRDSHGQLLPEGDYTFSLIAQAPGLSPLQRGAGVVIDDASLHGMLQVHVTERGKPIRAANVGVSLASTGAYVDDNSTDATGMATFDLAPGHYDLTAVADDGAQATLQAVPITTGSRGKVTIALTPPAPAGTAASPTPTGAPSPTPSATGITGTLQVVVDASAGQPANGAEVSVYAGKKNVANNFTDSTGTISFTLNPGTYTLTVSFHDASATIAHVVVVARTVTVQHVSLGSGQLQVLVETSGGKPADGAEVSVYAGTKNVANNFTDSSGMATFTLMAGTYTLTVSLGDAEATRANVVVMSGATTHQTIGLGSGTLVVLAEMAPGQLAVGAEVSIYAGSNNVANNFTDSTGTISFTLNAGTYTIQTSLGDANGPVTTAVVSSGTVAKRTIVLNAGKLAIKVLTQAGKPANGAEVSVNAGANNVANNFSDATGVVTFTLNTGSYDVVVSQGNTTNAPAPVQVTEGHTSSYTIRLGEVGSQGTASSTPQPPATTGQGGSLYGHNLIVNGDAESGPGAMDDDTFIAPPGWKTPGLPGTAKLTVASYMGTGLDSLTTTPGPPDRGKNYFYGGPSDGHTTSAEQRIDLSAVGPAIDGGHVSFVLSGWLGGYSSQGDDATLRATFLDAGGKTVGSASIGPVTPSMRNDVTELRLEQLTKDIPVGARSVVLDLLMTWYGGSDNDGLADDLSLILTAP